MVHLRTAQGMVDVVVEQHSQVCDAVQDALGISATQWWSRGHARRTQILLGGESIAEGSFEDHGVQEGATIDVVKDEFERVVDDLVELHPHIENRERLTNRATFNEDGSLWK